MTDRMTTGDLARHFGVEVWKIRRLYERQLLPNPERICNIRVFTPDQLPIVEGALRAAGYLKSETSAVA